MITPILLSVVILGQGEPLEFHLLNPHGYPENVGILTVTKGEQVSAVSFEAVANATHPEKVCQFMGYDTTHSSFVYLDNIVLEIPSSDIKDLPRVLASYDCPDDAVNATDCLWLWDEDDWSSPVVVVMCGKRHNGTVQIEGFDLLTDELGHVSSGSPGVATLTYVNPESGDYYVSVLCFIDDGAADLACRHLGYDQATSRATNQFEVLSRNYTKYFQFLANNITCGEAKSLDECKVSFSRGECSEGDEVVVYCENRDDARKIVKMQLVAGNEIELRRADTGIAKVFIETAHSYTSGLVYYAGYRAMELACQFMGYKNVTYKDFNFDFKYASRDGVLDAGYAIDSIICSEDAKELEDCDVEFTEENHMERLGTEMVFECGNGEDDDNYELRHLGLYTIRSEFNLNATNPGVLLITLSHREEAGFVYKANHHAMELACKQMGYSGLRTYEYNENFEFAYELFADLVGYLIDEVQCPEDAQDFKECKVRLSDPGKKKAPGHELVLHCGMNDEYELEGIHLVAGRGNELNKADMGIAKVYLKMAHSYTSGLVYTANYRAMELACQFMGYKNVTYYDFNFDFKYASREGVLKAGYAIESVYCPDDAQELKYCDVQLAEGDLQERLGTEMVFECGNGEDDDNYELEHLGLYTIRSESDVAITNPGVVFISLSHSKGAGFVYKANHHAMVLACKQMGYPGLKTYGHNEDFEFVTKQFTDLLGYLIDEVECPENAQDFNECKVRLSDPEEKKESGHELVLHCGMNDGEDDGIGAISYDFGGFKSTIKINKAKGKILIEDIIDYIFG